MSLALRSQTERAARKEVVVVLALGLPFLVLVILTGAPEGIALALITFTAGVAVGELKQARAARRGEGLTPDVPDTPKA